MRNLCLMVLVLFTFSCSQKEQSDAPVVKDSNGKVIAAKDAPVMKFEKDIYDFGVITEGEMVTYNFTFKNTGKTPLIITNAVATCGCTVPEYPNKPVKPGESGKIKIVFNSIGKVGMQDKVVTLTANTIPENTNLHVVGEIKAKK